MMISKFRYHILFYFILLVSTISPSSKYILTAQKYLPNGFLCKALFVPHDPVKDLLLGLIEAEQQFIYGALFRLSDKDIAQKLIEAHARGVKVRLVVDCTALGDKYGKLYSLIRTGINVYNYHQRATMHHKFFLFGKSIYQKQIIWTGSANPTSFGITQNAENVIVIENRDAYVSYMYEFNRLQKCAEKIGKTRGHCIENQSQNHLSHIKLKMAKLLKNSALRAKR